MKPFEKQLLSEKATQQCARVFATYCKAPCIVYLKGELGAGKTTFVRNWIQALGYADRVKSPTYTLVESYEFDEDQIHHFDLYRLHHPGELIQLGVHDYVTQTSLCLIEWPEKGESETPKADLVCQFDYKDDTTRQLTVEALTESGQSILTQIKRQQDDIE